MGGPPSPALLPRILSLGGPRRHSVRVPAGRGASRQGESASSNSRSRLLRVFSRATIHTIGEGFRDRAAAGGYGRPVERDMNVTQRQLDQAEIRSRRTAIAAALYQRSANIHAPDFEVIAGKDVELLFELYDHAFFGGWLADQVEQKSPQPLRCRVSSRMTRAGGKTTRWRAEGSRQYTYEIAVAARLLFLSFGEVDRPIRIGGQVCQSRLDALQRIIEHEIIHLIELLEWGESSCKQARFKQLIGNIFGHTESHHELITPAEDAAVRHQVVVGSMVRFQFEGRQLSGRVNRINRRATVLVESKDGQQYSDGKRYQKYYVPLDQLSLRFASGADEGN